MLYCTQTFWNYCEQSPEPYSLLTYLLWRMNPTIYPWTSNTDKTLKYCKTFQVRKVPRKEQNTHSVQLNRMRFLYRLQIYYIWFVYRGTWTKIFNRVSSYPFKEYSEVFQDGACDNSIALKSHAKVIGALLIFGEISSYQNQKTLDFCTSFHSIEVI